MTDRQGLVTQRTSRPDAYFVRVSREMVDRLVADESEPVVVVKLVPCGDGTHDMLMRTTDVIAENRRLRSAISAALHLNRQMCSDDEDNDSLGNMQHAILVHALERGEQHG